MHPRNPYRIAPSFEALARSYPPLAKYIQGGRIDFHDDAAQRCLTQALLKCDFNLEIQLPPDRLCPPVPNRLNYVLWIQDLVSSLRDAVPFVLGGRHGEEAAVRGLDIGTGASAIYPLLGCTLEPTWTFVATELDDRSYTYARDNVRSNGLSDRVCVVKVEEDALESDAAEEVVEIRQVHFGFDRLFCSASNGDGESEIGQGFRSRTSEADLSVQTVHLRNRELECTEEEEIEIQFTICNPPFYSSAEDVAESEAGKEQSAFGVCTGAPVEMITPGGEARLVGAMVRESVGASKKREAGGRSPDQRDGPGKRRRVDGADSAEAASTSTIPAESIQPLEMIHGRRKRSRKELRWYTSMLGKMSSVVEIVGLFKELRVTNYAITEFVQGQTRRWAVGWSLSPWRLGDDVARIANPNPTLQRLLPPRNTLRFTIGAAQGDVRDRLQTVLNSVEGASVTVVNGAEEAIDGGSGEDDAVSGHDAAPTRVECKCVVSAMRDTWSRGARRKRKWGDTVEGNAAASSTSTELDPDPELVCVITVLSSGPGREIDMEVRWLYGSNRALMESFASHVWKKVKLAMETPACSFR